MLRDTLRSIAIPVLIAGGAITLAGLAIFWDSLNQTRRLPVDGVILQSQIVLEGSKSSRYPHWTLAVRYSYKVAGQSYESDVYSSNPPTYITQNNPQPPAELQNLAAQYPPNSPVKVYVAPDDPHRAILAPPTSPIWLPLAAGTVVLIFGLLFLVWP